MKPKQTSFLDKALKFLSFRPRSEQETRRYLMAKQTPETEITSIIAKLKHLKFLDDVEFCLWWQRHRDEFRPRSSYILRQELIRKGIDKEIITTHLDTSPSQDLKRAKAAFSRRAKKFLPLTDPKRKNRAYRYLISRGFSYDIIKQVIH